MTEVASRPASSAGAQIVVGATGGIGRAFVQALVQRSEGPVHALSRSGAEVAPGALPGRLDLTDEASVASALQAIEGPIGRVLVTTGRLQGEGMAPERSNAALEADALRRAFEINTIGPALVAKHILPRLPKDRRAAFAVLSARVGSIGDNRLGGWHSYRASKAALNMLVRTWAVELARTHPQAVCVALHPGTVDTALSRPFQRGGEARKAVHPRAFGDAHAGDAGPAWARRQRRPVRLRRLAHPLLSRRPSGLELRGRSPNLYRRGAVGWLSASSKGAYRSALF